MSNSAQYLEMQQQIYAQGAEKWKHGKYNAIVGNVDMHNASPLYDEYLFKGMDTANLVALEYGCGPARNIINWDNRFSRIDGVDFEPVIEVAKINLNKNNIAIPNLYVTNGNSIPCGDNIYDVVYSVICLQHICVHEIRYSIFKEIYRVLKPAGYFCAQMGMGRQDAMGKEFYDSGALTKYLDNYYTAQATNGGADCSVEDEDLLKGDLSKLGFVDYVSDITNPVTGDLNINKYSRIKHNKWIWFKVKK